MVLKLGVGAHQWVMVGVRIEAKRRKVKCYFMANVALSPSGVDVLQQCQTQKIGRASSTSQCLGKIFKILFQTLILLLVLSFLLMFVVLECEVCINSSTFIWVCQDWAQAIVSG